MSVTVSIIIPAFNAHNFIGDAIESVLEQTLQDFEIVICDDNSTDATISVVESFSHRDSRIRLLRNTVNHGVSYSRNRAMDMATGHWIAVLDADDRFHPRRLETLLDLAHENSADLVCDDIIILSPCGRRILGTGLPSGEITEATELTAALYIARNSRLAFRYGYLNPIIRKKFIDQYGVRYDEDLSAYEDFDLVARCLIKGAKCILTNQALYFYRLTPGSLTRTPYEEWIDRARPVDLALLEMPEVQSNPELVSVLRARRKYFAKIEKFNRITNLAKAKNFWRALRELVTNVPVLPFFVQMFLLKARKRERALSRNIGGQTIRAQID